VLVGTLDCGSIRCVNMTMGYKHEILDHAPIAKALEMPNFLLKTIPHVDGTRASASWSNTISKTTW
jgi:acetoacetate decarboxylase